MLLWLFTPQLPPAIEAWGAVFVFFAGVVLALKTLGEYGGKAFRWAKLAADFILDWFLVAGRLRRLEKQFAPNGGSAMPERLERIETKVNDVKLDMETGFAQAAEDRESLRRKMGRATARLDAENALDSTPRWEWNAQGECVSVNPALCALFGRDERELLGLNWKNTIHSADEPAFMAAWRSAMEDGRDFSFQWRARKGDGKEIRVASQRVCERDAETGEVLGWSGKLWSVDKAPDAVREGMKGHHSPSLPPAARLLMVEDEEEIQKVFRHMLTSAGFDVQTVGNGSDAMQVWYSAHDTGEPFTLVMLDAAMPGRDGISVANEIRDWEEKHKVTPCTLIFATGNPDYVKPHIERLRIDRILTKPVQAPRLIAVVSEMIAKRGQG